MDAAYEVFIAESTTAQFDDFQQYVFELKTIATQNLAPKRIQEYMTIIYKEGGGLSMCQYVMDYIVVVLSKYLQMMVSYYIFREDSARVTSQFEQFNEHFEKNFKYFCKSYWNCLQARMQTYLSETDRKDDSFGKSARTKRSKTTEQ